MIFGFFQQNCFYGYVIFTMNKQKSLKLCDTYKNYFTVSDFVECSIVLKLIDRFISYIEHPPGAR